MLSELDVPFFLSFDFAAAIFDAKGYLALAGSALMIDFSFLGGLAAMILVVLVELENGPLLFS